MTVDSPPAQHLHVQCTLLDMACLPLKLYISQSMCCMAWHVGGTKHGVWEASSSHALMTSAQQGSSCNCYALAGFQSNSNSLVSSNNTNPGGHTRGSGLQGGYPHLHPGDPHPGQPPSGDSILIDSSGSWDGPHPGLAAAQGSSSTALHARTGPARAPLGIVRLPGNLVAGRERHGRLARYVFGKVLQQVECRIFRYCNRFSVCKLF